MNFDDTSFWRLDISGSIFVRSWFFAPPKSIYPSHVDRKGLVMLGKYGPFYLLYLATDLSIPVSGDESEGKRDWFGPMVQPIHQPERIF